MSRSMDDLSVQQPSMSFGDAIGINDFIAMYNNSTGEVKNLLANECIIFFKCCCCLNFFRSHLDFLTHKLFYCRTLCSTAASSYSAVAPDFARKSFTKFRSNDQNKRESASSSQQQNKEEAGPSSTIKIDSQSPKRDKNISKQKNLTTAVKKRVKHNPLSLPNSEKLELHALPRIPHGVPVATSSGRQQVMESVPHSLVATHDARPGCFLSARHNSSRYKKMNLRNRKGDRSRNGVTRKVGIDELKILERMDKYQTMLVDLSMLTCSHSDCKEKQPFSSLFTFAYHLTVKHNRRATVNKRIPCYLCDFESETYTALIEHLNISHKHYYQEHVTARSTCEGLKRGRKKKQAKAVLMRRSLSPLSNDFPKTEESSDGSEEIGYDTAPVLESMENVELENTDLAVKDRMDYIIAVVCGDVEKAPVLEDTKYEFNTQVLSIEKTSPSVPKKKNQGSPIRLCIARKRLVENVRTGEEAGPSKVSQESGKEEKRETELPKKRGRGRKPKPKVGREPKIDVEKDELSGSDEAEDGPKQRPSRQRRKPNWIDENYVTGFKNKRSRCDDDNADSEYASLKGRSRPPSRIDLKCGKSGDNQRLTPIETYCTILDIQSKASSEETSHSSTPVSHESTCNAATSNYELDSCAMRSPLPSSSAGPSSSGAENNRDVMTKKACRLLNTQRARRMKYGDDLLTSIGDEEIDRISSKDAKGQTTSDGSSVVSSDEHPTSQSRRKQDLSTIHENIDAVMVMRYSNGEASLPNDLSEIPDCLTEAQRDLFLSFIHPHSNLSDESSSAHKRVQCGGIIANISECDASSKCVSRAQ